MIIVIINYCCLIDNLCTMCCAAHDMYSLLFAFLDELLFRFCTDGFCCRRATIIEFNREEFKLKAIL